MSYISTRKLQRTSEEGFIIIYLKLFIVLVAHAISFNLIQHPKTLYKPQGVTPNDITLVWTGRGSKNKIV